MPNSIIMPIALYTLIVMPQAISARRPAGRLSGSAVMIVSG